MRNLLYTQCGLAILLFCTVGCTTYHEKFTYTGADGRNHEVSVKYHTLFVNQSVARLKVERQTEEFISNINADDATAVVDSASIEAIAAGVAAGVMKGVIP
jgi:hypothetical protein